MNLYEFFARIAPSLQTDADTLMGYSNEDSLGGFHPDPAQRKWDVGSIWEVEGKALYAIIRALKPKRVLEVGTHKGCSASHILLALTANSDGELTSIDRAGFAGTMDAELSKRWTFVNGDAEVWLLKNKKHFDLFYEDAGHGYEVTKELIEFADKVKAKIVISHDGMHFDVGEDIRHAWSDVYGDDYDAYLIEPSDCGFCCKFMTG